MKYPEGETVSVDEVVALIGEPAERSSAAAAEPVEAVPQPVAAEEEGAAPRGPEERPADAPQLDLGERVRKFSSPLVRKIAKAEGVDLEDVEGSGIQGRVTRRDIEAYLASRETKPTPPAQTSARQVELVPAVQRAPGEFLIAPYVDGDNVKIEPMSRIRRLTAAHMVYSKATSAHVTTVFHMDLARVSRIRARAKDGFAREHGTKLTYMPFIFKAVASALQKHAKLNASVDGTDIVYKKDINLGMAVALDWGLLVPVIKQADRLSLVGLAKAANDLADRARSKRLLPEEVQGGTFTITNPGVFGSLFGTPIINQPQVAILGLGVIEKRPVVDVDAEGNDIIAIKAMSHFAITYDHRLVDGADADHFMIDVKRTLTEESWSELEAFA